MLQTKPPRFLERREELYMETNKTVKRLARHDKRETMDQFAAEAEEAAVQEEQGKMYKITKRACGKYGRNTGGPTKDKERC
jgi:hypothetical protein